MNEIFTVAETLAKQLKTTTGLNTVVLNSMPAVYSKDIIYVIVPDMDEIKVTPYMSNSSLTDFDIELVQIAHEANMNRQNVIVQDVKLSMDAGNTILEKSLPRFTGLQNIDGAVIKYMSSGTSTWVTDTRIYSLFKITLSMAKFISY